MIQNMDIRQYHSWMYNRLMPGRRDYTNEFLDGVEEFVSFACQQAHLANGKIRCPCSKCRNMNYILPEEVKVHLYRKGFVPDYWYWTCHGENNPTLRGKFYAQCSSSTGETSNNEHLYCLIQDEEKLVFVFIFFYN